MLCISTDLSEFIVIFIYYENISYIVICYQQHILQKMFLLGEGFYMKEIVIEHNGIKYSKEDIIKLLDLVFDIVGEEV